MIFVIIPEPLKIGWHLSSDYVQRHVDRDLNMLEKLIPHKNVSNDSKVVENCKKCTIFRGVCVIYCFNFLRR